MNIPLKQALSIHPEPAYVIAKKLGRSAGWLSMVIRNMAIPTDTEKREIARILDRPVSDLFQGNTMVVPR